MPDVLSSGLRRKYRRHSEAIRILGGVCNSCSANCKLNIVSEGLQKFTQWDSSEELFKVNLQSYKLLCTACLCNTRNKRITEQDFERYGAKTCTRCGKDYPNSLIYFAKEVNRKDRLSPWCKTCKTDQTRRWKEQNRDQVNKAQQALRAGSPHKAREYDWKRNGIVFEGRYLKWEDYLHLLELQNGLCLICECGLTPQTGVVDHNGFTGSVCGILCKTCNKNIVGNHTGKQLQKLKNAVLYLENTGVTVINENNELQYTYWRFSDDNEEKGE